jgi:hypothetical protein
METIQVKQQMRASERGVHWLAGKTVEVVEWDHGDPGEEAIVKVKCEGKSVWMNPKDFEDDWKDSYDLEHGHVCPKCGTTFYCYKDCPEDTPEKKCQDCTPKKRRASKA